MKLAEGQVSMVGCPGCGYERMEYLVWKGCYWELRCWRCGGLWLVEFELDGWILDYPECLVKGGRKDEAD